MFRLAGVKFANTPEDGGRSRQQILEELAKESIARTVNLRYTVYDGEPAIQIRDKETKQLVGWVAKIDIAKVEAAGKPRQMTMFIRKTKYCWAAELDFIQAPSSAQYSLAKALCEKAGVRLPAYDLRAYGPVWELAKAGRGTAAAAN